MKRYALVIGIGEYDSPHLGKLSKPANDAKAVADILRQHGNFQDVTLLNSTVVNRQRILGLVTYETLDAELTKFLKLAKAQDALIYFTGHGFKVEEDEFEQRGYLATSSVQVDFKGKQIISQRNGFSFNKLNGLIQRAELSSLLMLLDCCHSGFLIEDDLVKKSLLAFSRNHYCLIAACRSVQESYALKSQNHSVFTGSLLESLLAKNARQGTVTALDVFGFIDRTLQGSGQEPIFLGMGGAIPVVSYATEVATEPDETCPYQGLEAFTEATAQFFFGRQADVEALWQKLEQSAFVPVIGASGSGKSSLVRAGLIPALKQSGQNWTVLEPIKPGEEPLTQLRKPLEELTRQISGKVQLGHLLRKAPEGLQPLIEQLPDTARFLLLVDQFEEVFTVCLDQEEQARFIQLITQVAALPNSRLAVVMTMRVDFVEACLDDEALKPLIQTQAVYLSPLTGSDLTDAIVKPTEKQGYRLTADLLAEIVKDTREEPGFLPLLQFALTKLWDCRDLQAHELNAIAYATIGKLAGALDSHADQLYIYRDYIDPQTGEIKPSAQQQREEIEQAWIRAIMLRLVRSGEGEKDTRQRQPKSTLVALAGDAPEAQQQIGQVLESLIKGRLLVSERETIDLAHEALITGWQRLADWCQESQELRRLVDRFNNFIRELEYPQNEDDLFPRSLFREISKKWLKIEPLLSHSAKKVYQQICRYRLPETPYDLEIKQYDLEIKQFKERLQILEIEIGKKLLKTEISGSEYENLNSSNTQFFDEKSEALSLENTHLDQEEVQQNLQNLQAAACIAIEQVNTFEHRMKCAQLAAEWLSDNCEGIVEVIAQYILSHNNLVGLNITNLTNDPKHLERIYKDINHYMTWLQDSLLRGEPVDESIQISRYLPANIYASAFEHSFKNLPIQGLNEESLLELRLYLEYLVSYLDCFPSENFQEN